MNSFSRRLICFLIFFFILSCSVISPVATLAAKDSHTIGETFVGETLSFDIGFWFFQRVATATLTLEKDKGGYRAVLKAHTTGFVDRVIQHREDVYTARLKEVDGGRRFATVSLSSSSGVNGKVRHGLKEIDRKHGVLKKHSWGGGKDEKLGTVRFDPKKYVDDPLGGFYNFRFGAYGKAEVGAKFTINTFPKEDFKEEFIKMKFAAPEGDKKNARLIDAADLGQGASRKIAYEARVNMSKDVFGTDLADIDIYFSKELLPLRAEARDIVIFTDVRGTLREVSRTK